MNKVGIIALTLILAMVVGLSAYAAPSPLKAPLPSWRGELHPLQIAAAAEEPMFIGTGFVQVNEPAFFVNLCSVGTPPYRKAEWDFDGDGIIDTTLVGTHDEVMADVTWVYQEAGVYTVTLTMTDYDWVEYTYEAVDYVTISDEECHFLYYQGLGKDPLVMEKSDALQAIADYFGDVIPPGRTRPIYKHEVLGVIAMYFSEEVN